MPNLENDLKNLLEQIATALEKTQNNSERIATAFERLVILTEKSENEIADTDKFLNMTVNSLEADFFRQVTGVYLEEEQLVKKRGGGKKSAVRVANNFSLIYPEFFMNQLPGIVVDVEKGGLLIFRKDGKSLCALKIYTDLGYGCRGERWYENMDHFVKEASVFNVPVERVFFLVISFRNGLDNEHVKRLLGLDISNKDLLEPQNRPHLEKYARKYVNEAKGHLTHPHDQVYFLAGKLHPNVLDEALEADLMTYEWFRPSVSELVRKIKSL